MTYKKITDLPTASTVADTDLFIVETLTGTQATTVSTFKSASLPTPSEIGLGNVDNTHDVDKPISTATQAALNLKANTADVTATYLPITTAASTYLSQSTAAGTYLSKTDASTYYLTQSSAATTYATKTELNTKQDALTAGSNITISEGTISATDTTYTAGTGIAISNNVISSTASAPAWGDITGTLSAQTDLQSALDAKQGTLTAGSNISISSGVISATDTIYTAGSGISITGTTIAAASPITVLTTSGTITLADNTVNTITPSGAVSFTLPTVTDTTSFHYITVQINMTSVQTFSFGTSYYFNATTPDLSEAGNYDLIYEYDNSMSAWVCGVIKKGTAS